MFSFDDIQCLLTVDLEVSGNKEAAEFNNIKPLMEADTYSFVWIKSKKEDAIDSIRNTKARILVCSSEIKIPNELLATKLFILSSNPKLTFIRLVSELFKKPFNEVGIHPTAIVDPNAIFEEGVYVGPYSHIGKVTVGKNVIIHGFAVINDDSIIGSNVTIHKHTLIGSEGFGFVRNESGILEKFPHFGNAIIEDNVEIFPFVNIDKGTLGETRIKNGSKIDHYCHIGHNSLVGENTVITASAVLCGGSQVGDRCWIGVGSIIKEKVIVGNDVVIGLGSVVTKNIPDGETWTGLPARPLKDFVELQSKLKKL